jgi:hypothetical protein
LKFALESYAVTAYTLATPPLSQAFSMSEWFEFFGVSYGFVRHL